MSPLKQVVWRHLILRPLLVRLIDSRGNVSLVARWLIQWVEWLVPLSHLAMVVRSVLVEVEVLCAIFLDQLHVLHFNRVVILVTHVVVDFIGIIGDVSDLLDVRCDGAVKPSFVVALAENMPLVHHLLALAFLPKLFSSTSLRPDPGAPVKPFEAHYYS